ncbi:uncharacterized protein LOC115623178 [Scaptodrosophila lebanonensis]|uniref:Uncharacterized protein LOC115623178 n=1 Tax=Drosophila lebanonensis TaxID=7225 RepID=A0A6J2TDR1_DROLE|nr:uncharacterized protein LOC115623178 [Scaptodrosophila lebanonensis]
MQNRRRWNIKKCSIVLCAALILYVFVLSSGYRNYEIDGLIRNSRPEKVWEYVADFNKMRVLNPTIINFKILSDHGHAHDWRYTVEYNERLSHWPYWLNTITAKYVVTKSLPDANPVFFSISSKHESCFFKGIYCLHAISEFFFKPDGSNTYANEKIKYQCPPLLGSVCRRELEFQRRAVMHNLTHIFSKPTAQ